MTKTLPDRFFITGTDTGVGKTLVSALLCLGLDSAYWKPVQSGLLDGSDSDWVCRTTEINPDRIFPERYKLRMPFSPHQAATIDGVTIELDQLVLPECRRLIVEGAGGVMVPLNRDHLIIDLIEKLDLPALIVSRSGLGTINHSVLTVKMLRERRIEVLGVIMNGEPNESNKQAIEHYAQTSVIAQIPPIDQINRISLISAFNAAFPAWKKNEQTV